MSLPSLVPVAYSAGNGVTIYQTRRSPDLWAVRRGDMWLSSQECLSIDGEWVYEPMPSSRTQAWLDKHRFATAESAAAAAALAVISQPAPQAGEVEA